MKKFLFILSFIMLMSSTVALASEGDPIYVQPSSASILVDCVGNSLNSYNIGGNNYFMLRDIAMMMSGTSAMFEVTWDSDAGAINLISGKSYTPVGGELSQSSSDVREVSRTNATIYIDGSPIALTTYNIGGNNYFMLRDIANLFDFSVVWDSVASNILIDTDRSYTFEQGLSSSQLLNYIEEYYCCIINTVQSQSHNSAISKEDAYETEVLRLLNKERIALGLVPLKTTAEHQNAAQVRADEAAISLSHTRPNGTSFSTAFDEAGIESTYRGENLGSGYKTPERFVDGLMDSDAHRENILNPDYRYVGIGYNEDNFWSQLFSK